MNTHEHRRLNSRINVVEAVIVFGGLLVTIQHLTVGTILPLAVAWMIGLGAVGGIWRYLDSTTQIVTYLYGCVLPVFAVIPFGHDGAYVAMYSLLGLFGAVLYATTVKRFGSWALGLLGFTLGVAMSSSVLYVL